MMVLRFVFAPLFWLRDIRDDLRKIRILAAMDLQFEIERASRVDRWPASDERKARLKRVAEINKGEPKR